MYKIKTNNKFVLNTAGTDQLQVNSNGDIEVLTGYLSTTRRPAMPDHVATKEYVDSVAQGLDVKDSVQVLSDTYVDLANPPSTIDSHVLVTGDRILLINQAERADNGIYVYNGAGHALTRSTDADSTESITNGLYVLVTDGNNYRATGWILTSKNINLGATHLEFVQFTGTGGLSAGAGIQFSGKTLRAVSADSNNIDISSAGINLTPIGNSGVYNRVTVDSYGRIVSGESLNYLLDNNIINIVGDATGSGRTTINLTLASTGVTAGTKSPSLNTIPEVTVDVHGRITYVGQHDFHMTADHIDDFSEAVEDVIDGFINLDPSTGLQKTYMDSTNTYTMSLTSTGVAAGTYGDETHVGVVHVDAQGRVTHAESVLINFPVKSVNGASGDVTVDPSGNLTIDKYFVGLGNLQNALQVINDGLVPSMKSGPTGDRPAASLSNIGRLYVNTDTYAIERNNGTGWDTLRPVVGGDINIPAGSGNSYLSTTGVTPGTYSKVQVDAKGRVLTGLQINSTDVTTALGFTPSNKAGDTFTGPVVFPTGALNNLPITFTGTSTAGFYSSAANTIDVVTSGVSRIRVGGQGRVVIGGTDNLVDLLQVAGNIKANDPTSSYHVATKSYVDNKIAEEIGISTTDDVDEGILNKYYTDTRARNAVSVSGNLAYDSATGVFSYTTPNTDGITEGSTNKYYTDTRVRNAIGVSGTGISYNNSTGVISSNATSNSLSNTIVSRDVSGNFSAGTISATLQGNAASATKLATSRTFAITGDASWTTTFDGTANVTAGLTLANTAVTAGSYGATNKTLAITVDSKGRVTALSQADINITSSQVSNWDTAVRTTAGAMFTDNLEYGVAAVYNSTSGKVNFNVADFDLAFVGDVTGTSTVTDLTNTTVSMTLANSGVTAGVYGGASAMPVLTVDAKGRLTNVSTTTLNVASTNISDFVEAAQDAVAPLFTAATHDGVSVSYNDNANTLAITNIDKGSAQQIFKNIVVNGSSTLTADVNNDSLTLAGGTGVGISTNAGTKTVTFTNTGVTSVQGTQNRVTVSASNGAVTFSTPQDIHTAASPTFNNLTLSGGNINTAATTAYLFPTNATTVNIASSATSVNIGSNAATVTIPGNLVVQGSSSVVNSTTLQVNDPMIEIGGGPDGSAPIADDGKDRGIAIQYYTTQARKGFYGRSNASGKFVYIPNATISADVASGAAGAFDLSGTDVLTIAGNSGSKTLKGGDSFTISGGSLLTTSVSNSTLTFNLNNTAVNAGTYGSATKTTTFTVDAQGRLTGASQQDIAIPSTQITDFVEAAQDATASMIANGTHTGVSTSYDDNNNQINIALLTTGVTTGTWNKVTVDTYGRVTAGTHITGTEIISTLGYTPLNKAGDAMSGLLTLSANPTTDLHAATKGYVDTSINTLTTLVNLVSKTAVKVATTASLGSLSGLLTIDGYTLQAGDRILVKNQATPSQNGIYVAASGSWTRSADASQGTLVPGSYVAVLDGDTWSGYSFICNNGTQITVGTTDVTFNIFQVPVAFIGGAGLTRTNQTFNVGTANTGRIVVNADNIDLAQTGVVAGSYNTVTVDAYGRVTTGSNTAYLTQNDTINVTGDVTGSGRTALGLTLTSTGVTPGTYGSGLQVPRITVDAKGRITSITTASFVGTVDSVAGKTGTVTLTAADVGLANLANSLQVINNGSTPSIQAGLDAAKPVPSVTNIGRLWIATDTTTIYRDTGSAWIPLSPTYTGDVTKALGGTTLTLSNSGVTAGSYGNGAAIPVVTVDAKGRVTGVTTTPITGSFTLLMTGDMTATGTSEQTITATLASTGVVAGTYGTSTSIPAVTVDVKGRITSATSTPISFPVSSVAGRTGAVTITASDVGLTSVVNSLQVINAGSAVSMQTGLNSARPAASTAGKIYISTDTGGLFVDSGSAWTLMHPALSGDATTQVGGTTITLANTGVTAGTYGSSSVVPVLTIDSKGRVTSAGTASIPSGTVTITGDISVSGTTGTAMTATLATSGVTAGTYGSSTAIPVVTVDSKGRVTSLSTSTISSALTFTGDATGSGSTGGSVALTLAASGVTAATYGSTTTTPTITVDSKGRVTSASNASIAFPVTSVAGRTGAVTITKTDVSLGNVANSLQVINAGSATSIQAGTAASQGVAGTAGRFYATTDTNGIYWDNGTSWQLMTPAYTGDVTKTAGGTSLTLATSGVTAGTYGSGTAIPTITVDAKGRVTSVSTTSISSALTFTGDVTGSGTTGGSVAMTLAASGATAGTYTKVTVNAKGLVTAGATATTSDFTEGTNLYYTDARARAAVSATGTNGLTYNSTTGAFSLSQGLRSTDGPTFSSLAITNDLTIGGNLTVSGSSVQLNATTVNVSDPMIYLATGNSANLNDIGFVGHLTANSTYQHTGLVRVAADGKWRLFSGMTTEPTTTITTSDIGFTKDTLLANIEGNTTGTHTGAVVGNADTATKLATARTITLAGDVTGSATFDGSANISITTTGSAAPKWSTARTLSFTGDATGSMSVDGSVNATTALTLAASGVTGGIYGSASAVPAITVNSKGLITAVTGTPIVITSSAVSDFTSAARGALSAGTGISYSSGTITNTGILSILAGGGISVANSSGNVTISNGDTGSAQMIYKNLSDGTNTAAAGSNSDTIRFRSSGGVTVTVGSNDATFGDNVLIGLTSVPNASLANSSITVTAGTGLSGGGAVSLGSSVTLTNSGVTSITGTTSQVIANASTGGVTLSLPQNIATSSSPTFAGMILSGLTGYVYANGAGALTASTTIPASAISGSIPSTTNAVNTGITDDTTTAATKYITWVDATSGNQPQKVTSTKLTFNPSTGDLTATKFVGSGAGLTSIPTSALSSSSVTVTAGSGLTGGGTVALGNTITLTNAGVTSAVAGTGITVSAATGAVTINNSGVTSITGTGNQITASASTGGVTLSLPQSIGTGNTVQFANVYANNFYDGTGTYNVNLGSGGTAGRGMVAGYSGGSYAGIGYNITHTSTGGVYNKPINDTTSYIRFGSGGFDFLGNTGTTAGSSIALTTLASLSGTGVFNAIGGLQVNGVGVITTGTVGGYAPGLTGTGASGTWGISISGNAATATNGVVTTGSYGNPAWITSLDASKLTGTLSLAVANATNATTVGSVSRPNLFNNQGNTHSTYQSFGGIPDYGFYHIQNNAAADRPSNHQFYSLSLGLGSDYAYGSYGHQIAFPRINTYSGTGGDNNNYMWIRQRESTTWSSWGKIYAGYADTAGTASNISAYTINQNVGSSNAPTFAGLTLTGAVTNSSTTTFNGAVNVGTGTNLSFGSQTRQMINLWGTSYGIGIQSSTTYFRSASRFSWHRGGVHSDTENDPGSGGAVAMSLDSSSNLNVTGDVVTAYSDMRLKVKEGKIVSAVDKVKQLDGFYYTDNELAIELGAGNGKRKVGLSAQQVKAVLPEATQIAPFDRDENGNSKSGKEYLTVQYEKLAPLFVEAIKEQDAKIEAQAKEIADLKNLVAQLMDKLK